jgi:hypothetical protein
MLHRSGSLGRVRLHEPLGEMAGQSQALLVTVGEQLLGAFCDRVGTG